jgi:protein TonB
MKKIILNSLLISAFITYGQTNNSSNAPKIIETTFDINQKDAINQQADPAMSLNTVEEITEVNKIYNAAGVEVQPEFPGGIKQLETYLAKNFRITAEMKKAQLKGKVFTTFIVQKDGSITDIKIIREIGHGTSEVALSIIKSMPKWNPASQNGKKVSCLYSMPISIDASKK